MSENTENHTSPKQGNMSVLLFVVLFIQIAMIGFYIYQMGYIPGVKPLPQLAMTPLESANTSDAVAEERMQSHALLMAQMGAQLEEISRRLSDAERVTQSEIKSVPTRNITQLMAEIQTLREEVNQLREAQTSDVTVNAILKAKETLETMQKEASLKAKGQWQSIQLITAYDRLKENIANGQPYSTALDAFRLASDGIAQQYAWLEVLEPNKDTGIASEELLKSALEESIRTYAMALSGEDDSIWGNISRNLARLVTVRKVGMQEGDDDQSIMARAEYYMNEGELQKAVAEIETLNDAIRPYFEAWLNKAYARLETQSTLQDVQLRLREIIQVTNHTP